MIHVVSEPIAEVVGRQEIRDEALVNYLNACDTGPFESDAPSDGEALVEYAARCCYWSFENPRPGGNLAMLSHLIESGHHSCLEHAVYNIFLAGVSRTCIQQLLRHRHLSPSMLSQRYFDESQARFVLPPVLIGCEDSEAHEEWSNACAYALGRYRQLVREFEARADLAGLAPTLRRKRAREAARSVLPGCVETRLAVTLNARSARHVLAMRGDADADLEIRRLAAVLASRLKAEAPNLFTDVAVVTAPDGWPLVTVGDRS